MRIRATIAVLTTLAFGGCDPDGDGRYFETTTRCTDTPDSLEQYVQELESRNIRYKIVPSNCIQYSSEGEVQLESSTSVADESLEPPGNFAPGRSTSWGERNDELVRLLTENEIENYVFSYGGADWVAWNLEDVELVEELLGYSEAEKRVSRDARDAYPDFNAPNN